MRRSSAQEGPVCGQQPIRTRRTNSDGGVASSPSLPQEGHDTKRPGNIKMIAGAFAEVGIAHPYRISAIPKFRLVDTLPYLPRVSAFHLPGSKAAAYSAIAVRQAAQTTANLFIITFVVVIALHILVVKRLFGHVPCRMTYVTMRFAEAIVMNMVANDLGARRCTGKLCTLGAIRRIIGGRGSVVSETWPSDTDDCIRRFRRYCNGSMKWDGANVVLVRRKVHWSVTTRVNSVAGMW